MDNVGKVKSFWEKPEGKTGMVFMVGIGVALLYMLYKILPFIAVIFSSLFSIVLSGIALFIIIYVLFIDTKSRTLIWYFYKLIMKKLTGMIIEIDPIAILEIGIGHLKDILAKVDAQITKLEQEIRKLKDIITANKNEMEKELGIASEAKKRSNKSQSALSANQAERLKESNDRLISLLAKLENAGTTLDKVYKIAEYEYQDKSNEVRIRKVEYNALKAAHSAWKSAMVILRGGSDKMEMFNQSMEFITTDISNKVGEIEHLVKLSSNAFERVDLENAVFDEKGFKFLEEWEKNSSIINNSDVSASATRKDKYSDLF
jgi:hypothetical protein